MLVSFLRNPQVLIMRNSTIQEVAKNGLSLGFGFEEWCCKDFIGDRSKFDPNGFAIGNSLFDYLKKELFLTEEEFGYQ